MVSGLSLCAMTMLIGGPVWHYVPGDATWTWHPPAGVATILYPGWLLNLAVGWVLGWGLGGVGRVARWSSGERGRSLLARCCAVMVCVTVSLGTLDVVAQHSPEHPMAQKSLSVGDPIPAFSLKSGTGEVVTREDLLGKGPVVIYFYPRDETTGCTAQACSFRDSYEVFTDAGAEVVGVSSDTVASHEAFAQHHRLPFILLADTERTLRRAFGVPRTLGLLQGRVTYVSDSEGVIRHVFDSQVRVNQHVSEALKVVQSLAGK